MPHRRKEFPQNRPREAGWYVVRLIADDGDGRVDEWNGVDKWNGAEFSHYRSAVAYFEPRRYEHEWMAREALKAVL